MTDEEIKAQEESFINKMNNMPEPEVQKTNLPSNESNRTIIMAVIIFAICIAICLISILIFKLCAYKQSYDEDDEQKTENLVI